MRIAFINRCKGEFWSIEDLFLAIARALPSSATHWFDTAPRSGASITAIVSNLRWASQVMGADLLHITGDIHYAAISIYRCPSVLTIHDLRFIENTCGLRRFLFWLLWIYLPCRRTTHVTVISQFTKQRLLSLVNIKPDKLTVIPDCVSDEFRPSPKGEVSSIPIVLHVGTTSNKNLERVACACHEMQVELWVLGRLTREQKALLQLKEISFREYFDLEKYQVVELYQKCDIVCFASLYEGFGMPILEAQAVGRPVVTSNIAPMDEVSGGAAMLVNPLDVASIRDGLNQLIRDQELRSRLVDAGYKNAQKYSAKEVAAQYFRLYQKVLAK